MQRFTRSLAMSVLAVCLMLSLQAVSKADSFHRAAISGRYHLDPVYATAFNVNATSSFFSKTGVTSTAGSLTISSNTLFVYAGVASVTSDTVSILGRTYAHTTVVSKPFSYKGATSHVVIEATRYTTYGQVGFQIIRNSDNAILAASWPAGFYAQMPLEYGGISIL